MTQHSEQFVLLGLFLPLSDPQLGCSRMLFGVSFGSRTRQSPAFLAVRKI